MNDARHPSPRRTRPARAGGQARRELAGHIERVALVLQGGGALGAFQAGAYQGLAAADYTPDWIAGTSIGAIHAALLAGNPPERRVEALRLFWQRISRPDWFHPPRWNDPLRLAYNGFHAGLGMLHGQPGFFRPRSMPPWLAPPATDAALSFYDVDGLRQTLTELVDFERLNGGGVRVSLGATHTRSGRSVYFDSTREPIRLEHVLASAALPPAFPPVEIDGELYWDGGIVSNTPLEVVMDDYPRVSTLCFMVDLFDGRDDPPATMDDVLERHKDITYASRSEGHIESFAKLHNLRRVINRLYGRMPVELQDDPQVRELAGWGCTTTMSIVHMIYRATTAESGSKDFEFSRGSIDDHWQAGLRDARRATDDPRWLDPPDPEHGVTVQEVVSAPEADADCEPAASPASGREREAAGRG